MTRYVLLGCLIGGFFEAPAASQRPDPVATAVLPLPDTLRPGATVIDYEDNEVLRRGTNGITCLTDRPGDNRLSLLCYPSAVEGYMRRDRQLSAEGIRGNESRAILHAEVKTGALYLPSGVLVRNVSGLLNEATGVPDSARVWSEFLLPFADPTALGIPEFDAGLDPWLMSAGRVDAHVMVRYRWVPWDEVE
jgi:hypothetical protein